MEEADAEHNTRDVIANPLEARVSNLERDVRDIKRMMGKMMEMMQANMPSLGNGQETEVPDTPRAPSEQRADSGGPSRSTPSNRGSQDAPTSADAQYFQQTVAMERKPPNRDIFGLPTPKQFSDPEDEPFLFKEDEAPLGDRRASLLRPTDLQNVIPTTAVSVYRDQPSFAHIKLEYLTVNQVFQFWTDILQYQTMYGIALKPTTLIGREARLTIMSKGRIKSEIEFFQLSDKHLRLYVQHAVRPTDKIMFATKLERSLWFWPKGEDNFVLSVDTFQKFYDRLQTYRQEFYQKFEFLAYNNAENIPKMENKEYGLIYIFLQKLPKEYGPAAFTQLSKSKFDNLEEFLRLFYEQAHSHYQKSITAKELTTFFNLGTKRAASKRDESKPRFVSKVNNIGAEDLEEEDYYGGNPMIPPKDARDDAYDRRDEDEESVQHTPDLNAFGGMSRGVPLRAPPKPPPPVGKPAVANKAPDGCFRALTDGKCSKPNCSFNHSLPVLEATYDELITKLNKKLWKARPINAIFEPEGGLESSSDKNG